ncbi:MAG: hypothetical protein JHC26_13145 [Thermofilum sp.]|nr:hypothetical protein [Thermofilum sp.]
MQPIDVNRLAMKHLGSFNSNPYGVDAQNTKGTPEHFGTNKKVINLSPYTINLVDDRDFIIHVFPRYAITASLIMSASKVDEIFGQPIIKAEFKGINNLPDPEEGVYYIVSSEVAEKAKRRDVICPDTDTAMSVMGDIMTIRNFKTFG